MENKPTPKQEVINAKIDELHDLLTENGYHFMFAAFSPQEAHPHNIGAMNATIKDLSVLITSLLENVELETVATAPFAAALQLANDKNPKLLKGFRKHLNADASFMERLKNLFS